MSHSDDSHSQHGFGHCTTTEGKNELQMLTLAKDPSLPTDKCLRWLEEDSTFTKQASLSTPSLNTGAGWVYHRWGQPIRPFPGHSEDTSLSIPCLHSLIHKEIAPLHSWVFCASRTVSRVFTSPLHVSQRLGGSSNPGRVRLIKPHQDEDVRLHR